MEEIKAKFKVPSEEHTFRQTDNRVVEKEEEEPIEEAKKQLRAKL